MWPVKPAFYATAAQVIPVLFLTIVFEQRIWHGKRPATYFGVDTDAVFGRFGQLVGLLTVLLVVHLFAGEAVALAALAGDGSSAECYIVAGALAIGGSVVVSPPLILGLQPLFEGWAVEKDPAWDLKLGRVLIGLVAVGATIHTLVVAAVLIF